MFLAIFASKRLIVSKWYQNNIKLIPSGLQAIDSVKVVSKQYQIDTISKGNDYYRGTCYSGLCPIYRLKPIQTNGKNGVESSRKGIESTFKRRV